MSGNEIDWWMKPAPRPALRVAGQTGLFAVRRIYCVGQNYRDHAREMGASGREPPFFFAKPADAATQASRLPFPPMTDKLHHEVELVVALGGGGRHVSAEQALGLVCAYAVGVDLTRRDLQAAAKQAGRPWTTAKGFDHSAPISLLRPAADGPHPVASELTLAVNGVTRQRGSTADMTWSVAEILGELSRYFELRPGDLVFTGTPPGVGPLRPGDRVEAAIEGVGTLAFELERS